MKFATGLAMAGLFALGMAGAASAQMDMMMSCPAACNSQYSQCVAAGTDTTVKSTPEEGLATIAMNGQNWTACGQQAWMCHASCWGAGGMGMGG